MIPRSETVTAFFSSVAGKGKDPLPVFLSPSVADSQFKGPGSSLQPGKDYSPPAVSET